jgi:hypothetical protein
MLLPFRPGCDAYIINVPRIAAVEQHPAQYNAKVLSVTGRVQRLDQWISRAGYPQQTFYVCDDGCIHVYMEGRSPIRNGELVSVRGQYYQVYRAGSKKYYNEIEASEVLGRE